MPRSRVHDGVVFRRKESRIWWIRYRDRSGVRRRESTLTEDWNEAPKRLRDRLQARDNNVLDVVKKGESLSFGQWADFFSENYSKPPIRAEKTHEVRGLSGLQMILTNEAADEERSSRENKPPGQ